MLMIFFKHTVTQEQQSTVVKSDTITTVIEFNEGNRCCVKSSLFV